MSRDGRLRFDLRVTHRVGLGEMATALAAAHRYHDAQEDGPLGDLGKARMLDFVRQTLTQRGSDYLEGWADDLSESETRLMWDWAEAQVLRHFPELSEEVDR